MGLMSSADARGPGKVRGEAWHFLAATANLLLVWAGTSSGPCSDVPSTAARANNQVMCFPCKHRLLTKAFSPACLPNCIFS